MAGSGRTSTKLIAAVVVVPLLMAIGTRFGAIDPGRDSDYLTVSPGAENYDNISFLMDGEDWTVDPLLLRPEVADLAAGRWYTILLDQDGDQVVVTGVTADPAPA